MLDGAGFSPPYDFNLVQALEAMGASVRLIMPESVLKGWKSPDGVPQEKPRRVARLLGRLWKGAQYAGLLDDARRIVRDWHPDVVHVQWLPLPPADRWFLHSIRGRVPLLYTMHNTTLFHGSTGGIQGWGLKGALRSFDGIVVHSEYSKASAVRGGLVREAALRVIPHGAFDYYRRLGEEPGRPARRTNGGPTELLFAGSIKRYKGLDLLIGSLTTLRDAAPEGSWHLTVAGQPGIDMSPLRELVHAHGLDAYVSWSLRHQSERELAMLLVRSDVVVLPYREIDQSGVLLAAIGVGCPVVATKVGAFPELLRHEVHGLLVPPDDPRSLGLALARLVGDCALRTACSAQMQQLASGPLAWSTVGRATLDLYRELISS